MKQYTVTTHKMRMFSGTVNEAKLSEILNKHAKGGWTLRTITAVSKRVFLFKKESLLLTFEQ